MTRLTISHLGRSPAPPATLGDHLRRAVDRLDRLIPQADNGRRGQPGHDRVVEEAEAIASYIRSSVRGRS